MSENVHVLRHPLLLHHLTRLRDRTTEPPEFRALVRGLTQLLFYEATHDLQMAINAGAGGIAVQYGAHSVSELTALQPLFSAGSVADLHAWLQENA